VSGGAVLLGRVASLVRELRRFQRHQRVCGGCGHPVGHVFPGDVEALLSAVEPYLLPWVDCESDDGFSLDFRYVEAEDE
jgi:hypothetical protein